MDKPTSRNPSAIPPPEGRLERAKRWSARRVPGGMRTVVLATAVVLAALLVWAIRPSGSNPANPPPFNGDNQPLPVGIAKAASGDINITLNALGTVTPLATVTVKPQVGGRLAKIDFTEGQMARSGQVLADVDPAPYQAALDQAQGQLARDQAQLANAEVDLTRYQKLIMENSIAQQQVDTQAALVRQLQGVIKSDQANVEAAQINLNYTRIRSPIAGRIGLRQLDEGNLVTANQATGIAVVTQLQPISVLFTVPEDDISRISSRVRSGATLETDAYDRAQTTKLASGTLATLDNEIDTTTGTVKLRSMFDNTGGELFPNQFVNVKLLVDTLHDQIVVPAAAIQRGASGTFVFVVNPDHTVSMRTVTLGQTDGDRVAVAKGLMSGDTVVTDGVDRLKDGARVVLPGEQAPAVASGETRPAANRGGGQGGGRRGGGGGRGGG